MPRILAAVGAFPEHRYAQGRIREAARALFSGRIADLERLLNVFDHARVAERQFLQPLDWYSGCPDFAERTRIFQEQGSRLLETASRRCLERACVAPAEIDLLIAVTSTGLATPTLDARLINALGCRPRTARLPIWGLGCAAGAAGLARAFDYCLAHPQARVLLTALEACSLTFIEGDLSKKNLVATAIFGDGAAAVLVAGDGAGGRGPQIVANRSHLFPDSYRVMGWDFAAGGDMELVLSPKLPAIVKQEVGALVDDFLSTQGLSRRDLGFYLTHPGGARVIDAFRQGLGLQGDELRLTEEVLRQRGNVSSVSVLVVLEQWLASGGGPPGFGLLSAFGPGFSAELVLLEVKL